jgi:hypothetical protein
MRPSNKLRAAKIVATPAKSAVTDLRFDLPRAVIT